ncbi:4-alpha-glucanotransferase [Thioalkalivibrio denitrificans]|uniref:4-alpha-glucanotransferase n=1 Tax=Thioalkalivibrio denitrificans TaxID=108003 RepID=A0A1V3N8Q4_9GAMM|nr:4-alpha-glucanotransferase [Thioalkalivibrio denitrificans]OOG21440.1 4-alpha-glucanotransferase [Thioalkalivibrio denitrificans]
MTGHTPETRSPLHERRAGVLLHPTSLPGPGQAGTLGPDAHRFLDFLEASGMSVWQMLPLSQPHEGGSPYQCMSVNAGNIDLICQRALVQWGWLEAVQPESERRNPFHCELLRLARQGFLAVAGDADREDYHDFVQQHGHWLEDYALYLALKQEHRGRPWWEWEPDLRDRHTGALKRVRNRLHEVLQQYRFDQYVFYRQWAELRDAALAKGIGLFGDMPIFVAHDSAEVWARRHLFDLDDTGQPRCVAGVPPDYFSETGQRWGNPHYDWSRMASDGFQWWIERIAAQLELVDLIRIDHFRGFEAFWSIPADEPTAVNGHWVQAPGDALFRALQHRFGELPLVAEDLGVITPEVEALRDRYALPGMKILQFAFEGGPDNPYLPHAHESNCVVYTGTHDNDTTLGWFNACDKALQTRVLKYLGNPSDPMPWPLVRSALASVARLAVVPLQDLLGLDSRHRMNVPGTTEGNWTWRFTWDQFEEGLEARVREMVETYGRKK